MLAPVDDLGEILHAALAPALDLLLEYVHLILSLMHLISLLADKKIDPIDPH
jgi:hypothetical protein